MYRAVVVEGTIVHRTLYSTYKCAHMLRLSRALSFFFGVQWRVHVLSTRAREGTNMYGTHKWRVHRTCKMMLKAVLTSVEVGDISTDHFEFPFGE